MTTTIATATAMLGWLLTERIRDGKPTTLGAASGIVAGLVAITPSCSSVNVLGALVVGLVAGILSALACGLKFKLGFDDSLDVVGVHLVGGLALILKYTIGPRLGAEEEASGVDEAEHAESGYDFAVVSGAVLPPRAIVDDIRNGQEQSADNRVEAEHS
jgi:ammonium transporter, Amt family